ncbi:Nucleotide-binding universal stress protein, UspA family [Pseudonocardia thermophila]|uniref:Nucleotide-binding universal stress protein, UspA family n=1 Tax=Pseudonocardia thermophila TaxID=1848 RepID=A0A1M6V025_PSETH|nr:universal stress protein [Pseudonocardia thermophila]SHK74705.1 Nucleotide-binding universal stress protein, UspA family [Pseudonocardia thermophila]
MPTDPDPRPVVAAVDESGSSRDAALWAADLAADWSAPLHLLHVPEGDPQDPPRPAPDWLAELADGARRSGADPVTTEVQPGEVVPTVAGRAVGARMVVLGSYGRGAAAGMLAGSVALGVAGRVACPIAVVRGSASQLPPPRSGPVVVGVDDSPAGSAAVAFAADLAESLGTELLAVHAWTDVVVDPEGVPVRRRESPTELAAEAEEVLDRRLQPVLAAQRRSSVVRRLVEGTPLQVLLDAGRSARVLVVGTRGRTGFTGILTGSTSTALIGFAPCPVIVVHPRATNGERTGETVSGEVSA